MSILSTLFLQAEFFNSYLADPKRPQVPEGPSPQRLSGNHVGQMYGHQGAQSMMGWAPRPQMMMYGEWTFYENCKLPAPPGFFRGFGPRFCVHLLRHSCSLLLPFCCLFSTFWGFLRFFLADSCARACTSNEWVSWGAKCRRNLWSVDGNLWTEICGRKLWTVDGSESILTTPPRFGLTKVQINFRCRCNKQLQTLNNVCIL